MSFKLLLRGAASALGEAVCDILEDHPYNLLTPSYSELDWTDDKAVLAYLNAQKVAFVVNLSAPFLSEDTDHQSELAETKALAKACAEADAPLLHASSHLVLDGADDSETLSERTITCPSD